MPPIDLPYYDIPKDRLINKYMANDNTSEMNELRKEFAIELQRKEEELKRERELEIQKKREMLLAEANKHKKQIDNNQYTFDPSGKVIPRKRTNTDFLANEFWWAKPYIRGGIQQVGSMFKPKIERMKSHKVAIKKTNKENEELISNEKQRKNSIDDELLDANIQKLNENTEVIKNDDRRVHPNDYYNPLSGNMKHINRGAIITGGDNYSLMNPEIGVIIKQNSKNQKDGGFEFSHKFKVRRLGI